MRVMSPNEFTTTVLAATYRQAPFDTYHFDHRELQYEAAECRIFGPPSVTNPEPEFLHPADVTDISYIAWVVISGIILGQHVIESQIKPCRQHEVFHQL
jgi:hypothetical protein